MIKSLTGIGECMIELSELNNGLLKKGFAGDVVNTLWYARKGLPENVSTNFFTGLGADQQSSEMIKFLNAAGICTSDIVTIEDRRPGLYMIHLTGAERSFSYWRDNSAAKLLADDKNRLDAVIEASDAIYLSGITLAILPPKDRFNLIERVRNARDIGKIIAFDPNIRPALWSDSSVMRSTISACADASSIVFPSFDDEAAAFGDATSEKTAQRYSDLGVELVLVKDGSKPSIVSHRGELKSYETPAVNNPVDTTGAGDSFNGAFLAAYFQSNDVEDALAAAHRCSAEVICVRGALA